MGAASMRVRNCAMSKERSTQTEFGRLMGRLQSGDDQAAAEVYRRFVRRLIALACRQFEPWTRAKADHEDVVQSAFKSFFARFDRGEFVLSDWDDLWNLLVVITVRKCRRRQVALRRGRRDAAREVTLVSRSNDDERPWEAADREPSPDEAAMLAELLQQWLRGMSPGERAVTELGLQGLSTPQIAERLKRTERTVRRIHASARDRLDSLLEVEGR
jgi:RNA polymerase sigma-70 factor (ECF subfamily)